MAARFEEKSEDESLCSKKYVSKWTLEDLERLSIFYENSSIPLLDLIARAKVVAWKGRLYEYTTPPAYYQEFESILRQGLTFSLPYDSIPRPVNILETEQDLKFINRERECFIGFATETKSQMHLSKSAELYVQVIYILISLLSVYALLKALKF